MLEFISQSRRQYVVVIVANLSVVCFGMGLVWSSPVLVKLSQNNTVLSRPVTDNEASWIVSIDLLASIIFYFLPAFIPDIIGRKYSMILGCVPRLIMALMCLFATELWMILFGRFCNGIAEAFTFTIVPMYASEIADKEGRGTLGTIFQVSSCFGILLMLSIGPFVSYTVLNTIFLCLTVSTTVPMIILPESPYFLYSKGKIDETKNVLVFLRDNETVAKEEIKEYGANNEVEINKRELLTNKTFLKAAVMSVIIGVWIQLLGFNTISFYLQTILETTKTSVKPEIVSVIIGAIQLSASFLNVFITDRFGRKPILIVTLIGMTAGMIGLGTFFTLQEQGFSIIGILNYLPLMSLVAVVYCFSGGLGSLYYVVIAEIFEGPLRAIGMTISLLSATIVLFIICKYFPLLSVLLKPSRIYFFFTANCLFLLFYVIFFVPETKGKSIREIKDFFGCKDDNKNAA